MAHTPNSWWTRLVLGPLAGVLGGASALLVAQEVPPTPPAMQPGMLPEVVVQPERTEVFDDLFDPLPGDAAYDFGPTFPSLSEQRFGGLDSVLRSDRSLFDVAPLATIIGPRELNERLPSDMARTLQYDVGLLMQSTARGQVSPFVRGLTGQQVLVLVDGVRQNNSTYRAGPNQYFALIDPGSIQRLEVLRGSQGVLWGSDAIGGVINVVTRGPDMQRGDYSGVGFREYLGSADTSSYSRLSVEGWSGNAGVYSGGMYHNANDLQTAGVFGEQPFTGYSEYNGDLKFNYLVDDDTLLTVALQHFEQMNLPRSDRFPPFVNTNPPNPINTPRPTFFDPQQRDMAYVRLQGLANNAAFDAYSLTGAYLRNKEGSVEIRNPANDIRDQEFNVHTGGTTMNFSKDLGIAGRIVYGGDYYWDDVNAYRFRTNNTNNTVTPLNPQFPNDATYERVGAYLNWDVRLTEKLLMTAGTRYENCDAAGTINEISGTRTPFKRTYSDWVGGVGFVYEWTEWFHSVGGVNEGFRAPNLDDLTADNTVLQAGQDSPSLNVQPEHSLNYEIGFKINSPRLRMQVMEFWTSIEDNILRQPVPNPNSSTFIRANFDSYINGTEVQGEYLLTDLWSAYGNFAYIYGQDLERNEPLSRIPPTQGVAGLRWRDDETRRWFEIFTYTANRQDRYSAQNIPDSRFIVGGTPGYGLLNMRMGTALGDDHQHRFSLALENITDRAYRVLGSGVDGAGFNAIAGYELVR